MPTKFQHLSLPKKKFCQKITYQNKSKHIQIKIKEKRKFKREKPQLVLFQKINSRCLKKYCIKIMNIKILISSS